jgi:hypothetical protein
MFERWICICIMLSRGQTWAVELQEEPAWVCIVNDARRLGSKFVKSQRCVLEISLLFFNTGIFHKQTSLTTEWERSYCSLIIATSRRCWITRLIGEIRLPVLGTARIASCLLRHRIGSCCVGNAWNLCQKEWVRRILPIFKWLDEEWRSLVETPLGCCAASSFSSSLIFLVMALCYCFICSGLCPSSVE